MKKEEEMGMLSTLLIFIVFQKVFLNDRWLGLKLRWLGSAQPSPTLVTPLYVSKKEYNHLMFFVDYKFCIYHISSYNMSISSTENFSDEFSTEYSNILMVMKYFNVFQILIIHFNNSLILHLFHIE